jgi:NAD(P)-dependent dehydrogenase (short-subunit alcohol dehydrogenase family)
MSQPSHSPTTGVLITGGASGIGLACASALAEAGRPIALWALNESAATTAAKQLAEQFGVATIATGLDVRNTAAFPDAISAARGALGSLGGLVHSAGVASPIPIDEIEEESWDFVLDINLRAQALLVKALLEDLRSNPGSAVVGISSINAILGNQANPAYGASKAGLLGLTRSLADRLAADGVRVNAVCPGYVRTPMLEASFEQVPTLRDQMEHQAMLGRLAEPGEIARAVRFLMSDDASFITAEHLVVDGGAIRSQR